ncbi:hypothetical protein [Marinifilum flexuosum]|uniref:Uncharacterized protein n=1 Tax=Marinifilum flexuosum TaxID=1117708 RepID=A0A419WMP5_9BACT|nr:hypothetical protein [Marinifilum flexuosum]RKD96750.1 hypothetical protein BXY64_3696 [Marinifilum flexuosum]
MSLIEIKEDELVIKRAELTALVDAVQGMREEMKNLTLNAKLDVYCKGDIVTGKAVRMIMGWSESTFSRRLQDEENPIPMTKEGKGYAMPRAEFIEYYNQVFNS